MRIFLCIYTSQLHSFTQYLARVECTISVVLSLLQSRGVYGILSGFIWNSIWENTQVQRSTHCIPDLQHSLQENSSSSSSSKEPRVVRDGYRDSSSGGGESITICGALRASSTRLARRLEDLEMVGLGSELMDLPDLRAWAWTLACIAALLPTLAMSRRGSESSSAEDFFTKSSLRTFTVMG